jgi:serine/threonine protein phosphatase 1
MRTLVISDIHGYFDQFNALLTKVGYDVNQDQLILLGDYVDRGSNSKSVVEQVMQLHSRGAVVLLGNHDQMFLDAIFRGEHMMWLSNGGQGTFFSYCGNDWFGEDNVTNERYYEGVEFIKKNFAHHLEFLSSLPYFYEDNKHVFVHAGLDPDASTNWREQGRDNFLWIREKFLFRETGINKQLVFGHTPTVNMQPGNPGLWWQSDKVGIDGGMCFGHQLNCLEITNGKYYEHSYKGV